MKRRWSSRAKDIPRVWSREEPSAAKMEREGATNLFSLRQERLSSVNLQRPTPLQLISSLLFSRSSSSSPPFFFLHTVFLSPRIAFALTTKLRRERHTSPRFLPRVVPTSYLPASIADASVVDSSVNVALIYLPFTANFALIVLPVATRLNFSRIALEILDGVASRIYVLKEVGYWSPGRQGCCQRLWDG